MYSGSGHAFIRLAATGAARRGVGADRGAGARRTEAGARATGARVAAKADIFFECGSCVWARTVARLGAGRRGTKNNARDWR